MLNNYFRYYNPTILKSMLPALALALYFGSQYWQISISILGAIGAILYIIDKYLWKYRPFCWCFWTTDFSGRYEGTLDYEYRDEKCELRKGSLKHTKLIYQTASVITINSFTFKENGEPSSHSKSIEVVITREPDDSFTLTHTYRNEGNPALGYPPHYGTEIIKFIKTDSNKKLIGLYYTNRMPQTKGEINNLTYIDNNLNHDF